MTSPQKGRIFISYRRADSGGYAGRIYDRLTAHFGMNAVFMDVETIGAGLDFTKVLQNAVQSCDVLVALIGPRWLDIKDADGKRRLENSEDFVRIEIAAALSRDIRVIPVLFDGVRMPYSTELPDNLRSLAHRNALQVNLHSFNADARRLISQLELALKSVEDSRILNARRMQEEHERKEREAREEERARKIKLRKAHLQEATDQIKNVFRNKIRLPFLIGGVIAILLLSYIFRSTLSPSPLASPTPPQAQSGSTIFGPNNTSVSASPTPLQTQSGCSVIYDGDNGWVIDMCATDPAVSTPPIITPMLVLVDGVSKGDAALIRIYHQQQRGAGSPQVAVIYATGYVRLKHNTNSSPATPFGASFILGPAYWPNSSTYYQNPQLTRFDFDTTSLPDGPLRMEAHGINHAFAVAYDMTLPTPQDSQTRLHVTQRYVALANVAIDRTRRAEHQGFKLVQAVSRYINEGASCDGGYTDCHDSDGARFIGNDLERHQVAFSDLELPAVIFNSPVPLGNTWIDLLHDDDESWQSQTGAGTSGNTPNVRIALDELPTTHTITPQGWISATTDPNNDNVGLWLHDDGPASVSWRDNQSDSVSYWLIAQDDPPDP